MADFEALISLAVQRSLRDDGFVAAARGVVELGTLEQSVRIEPSSAESLVREELAAWTDAQADLHGTEIQLRGAIRNALERPTDLGGRFRALFLTRNVIADETERRVRDHPQHQAARAAVAAREGALLQSLVEKCALPALRTVLNGFLVHDPANTLLTVSGGTGLGQLLPSGFDLTCRTRSRLELFVDSLSTASIGVAGPRGSGKTTLLSWFCSDARQNDDLRVMLTAPVRYESRDYLLHVLSAVGRTCLRDLGEPSSPVAAVDPPGDEWVRPYIVRHLMLGAAVLGAAFLVAWAGGLLVGAIDSPASRATLGSVSGLVLCAFLYFTATCLRIVAVKPIADVQVMRHPQISATAIWAASGLRWMKSVAVVGGLVLAVLWYRGTSPPVSVVAASIGVVLGLTLLHVLLQGGRDSGWDARDQEPEVVRYKYGRETERGRTYADTIREILVRVSHQRATTAGQADRIGTSASFGITISADTTTTTGESITTIPWTVPEIVGLIRELLSDISTGVATGKERRVVLAIDELDKVEDSDQVVRFIDDLKAIFGVPGCYYLVAVSNDALMEFERRGMPFRTAFDSAFDEVLSLGYFGIEESKKLLRSRVVAIPVLFIGLCHALSGGLPRDLLRVARRLYALPLPVRLEDATTQLVAEEVEKKIYVLSEALSRITTWRAASTVVEWLKKHDLPEPDSRSLFLASGELLGASMRLDTRSEEDREVDALGRLCLDVAAFLYFGSALLDVSRDDVDVDRVAALVTLSSARQMLSLHPALAWEKVSSCRSAAGWPVIGYPAGGSSGIVLPGAQERPGLSRPGGSGTGFRLVEQPAEPECD